MDSTGLFRAEALEARRSHALGSVRLASPWPIRLAAWGSAIACVILGILLYIGQYSKREHASGVLVPSAGLIDVVANHAGVVEKVVVQEGESVSEGEPLLWISNTRINESLQDAEKISAQQLRESRRRLAEDLANQQKLNRDRASAQAEELDTARAELKKLDEQIAIQQKQAERAHAILEKIAPLETKGYISALQVNQQEVVALDADAQLRALERDRLRTAQKVATALADLKGAPELAAKQTHELEDRIALLERQIADAEVERTSVVVATRSGIVSSLLVKAGQAVAAAQPALTIVPDGSPLEGRVLLPSRAIAFVKDGSSVVLRYDSFPFGRYGTYQGRVKKISTSAMTPSQASLQIGNPVNGSFYRVDVAIDQQSIPVAGGSVPLRAGMAFVADITLDHQSLFGLLFSHGEKNP